MDAQDRSDSDLAVALGLQTVDEILSFKKQLLVRGVAWLTTAPACQVALAGIAGFILHLGLEFLFTLPHVLAPGVGTAVIWFIDHLLLHTWDQFLGSVVPTLCELELIRRICAWGLSKIPAGRKE